MNGTGGLGVRRYGLGRTRGTCRVFPHLMVRSSSSSKQAGIMSGNRDLDMGIELEVDTGDNYGRW